MSNINLKLLAQAIPSDAWESKPTRWFPLFNARSAPAPRIGVSATGTWLAVNDYGASPIGESSPAWLLALEYPVDELRKVIELRCRDFSLAFEPHLVLPYEQILMEGLTYGNDGGVLRAIEWMEQDRTLLTPLIRDELEQICRNRRYGQRLRHRAAKLAAPLRGVSN